MGEVMIENKACKHMLDIDMVGACGQCYGALVAEVQRLQNIIPDVASYSHGMGQESGQKRWEEAEAEVLRLWKDKVKLTSEIVDVSNARDDAIRQHDFVHASLLKAMGELERMTKAYRRAADALGWCREIGKDEVEAYQKTAGWLVEGEQVNGTLAHDGPEHHTVCDEKRGRDCNGAGCSCWCHEPEPQCQLYPDGNHRDQGGMFVATCACGWKGEP
jgi:hypothetical protein